MVETRLLLLLLLLLLPRRCPNGFGGDGNAAEDAASGPKAAVVEWAAVETLHRHSIQCTPLSSRSYLHYP